MAADPRKRQKKLQRRAGKRQDKRRELSKSQNIGLGDKLVKAAQFPVLHARATQELWSKGLGWVLFSRLFPDGRVAFAMFLVDRYCLGVKNISCEIGMRTDYERNIVKQMNSKFEVVELTPATARKFIEGAVAYAADLGFAPHADYAKVKAIFGDIDPADSSETLEYGDKGKPFFIAGPNEGPARCRQILSILNHRCGEGGYHFLIPVTRDELGEAADRLDAAAGHEDDGDDDGDDGPLELLDEDEVRRLPKG